MSKAYITIEQIDNGFIIEASERDDDTGGYEQGKFAVGTVAEMLTLLAVAFQPKPRAESDDIPVETADSDVEWPESTDTDPTIN